MLKNYKKSNLINFQGSEPLSVMPNNVNECNRTRDSRSVDPPGFSNKFQRKPPSGRRGSCKIDNLPPRLQRKYLAENGLDMPLPPVPPLHHHPQQQQQHMRGPYAPYAKSTVNDDWDGSTVTFQVYFFVIFVLNLQKIKIFFKLYIFFIF